MKVACSITLDDRERSALEQKARGRRTPARLVTRAKIVLLAAQGWLNKDIALEVGVGRDTVGRWRTRFVEGRLAGIEKDAPRGGRKPTKRTWEMVQFYFQGWASAEDLQTHITSLKRTEA